jgi:hypothetical protein
VSGKIDLENRVVAPIRHYREALTRVENLEREDSCAHRALMSTLVDLDRAMRGEVAAHLKNGVLETSAAVVARSNEARDALLEATAQLDPARLTLAGLERQLGYVPKVSMGTNHE